MDKKDLLEKFSSFLDSVLGGSNTDTVEVNEVEVPVVKNFEDWERRALFVVLEPQDSDMETADLHQDWYDEDTVKKACHNYNAQCERLGIMHKELASDSQVVVQESYIAPCDFVTEAGENVKKGSWLMWIHFPDEDMWEDLINGVYDSVSIECTATAIEL